ncbi:MAG: hypothetical protein HY078_00870 [Elusimicrobia bacterium]|nr:hypothetical protein [Elusimicrobiota bacterium]
MTTCRAALLLLLLWAPSARAALPSSDPVPVQGDRVRSELEAILREFTPTGGARVRPDLEALRRRFETLRVSAADQRALRPLVERVARILDAASECPGFSSGAGADELARCVASAQDEGLEEAPAALGLPSETWLERGEDRAAAASLHALSGAWDPAASARVFENDRRMGIAAGTPPPAGELTPVAHVAAAQPEPSARPCQGAQCRGLRTQQIPAPPQRQENEPPAAAPQAKGAIVKIEDIKVLRIPLLDGNTVLIQMERPHILKVVDREGKLVAHEVQLAGLLSGLSEEDLAAEALAVANEIVQTMANKENADARALASWLRDIAATASRYRAIHLVINDKDELTLIREDAAGVRRIERASFGTASTKLGISGSALVLKVPIFVDKTGTVTAVGVDDQGKPMALDAQRRPTIDTEYRWKEFLADGTLQQWRIWDQQLAAGETDDGQPRSVLNPRRYWTAKRTIRHVYLGRYEWRREQGWQRTKEQEDATQRQETEEAYSSKLGRIGKWMYDAPVLGHAIGTANWALEKGTAVANFVFLSATTSIEDVAVQTTSTGARIVGLPGEQIRRNWAAGIAGGDFRNKGLRFLVGLRKDVDFFRALDDRLLADLAGEVKEAFKKRLEGQLNDAREIGRRTTEFDKKVADFLKALRSAAPMKEDDEILQEFGKTLSGHGPGTFGRRLLEDAERASGSYDFLGIRIPKKGVYTSLGYAIRTGETVGQIAPNPLIWFSVGLGVGARGLQAIAAGSAQAPRWLMVIAQPMGGPAILLVPTQIAHGVVSGTLYTVMGVGTGTDVAKIVEAYGQGKHADGWTSAADITANILLFAPMIKGMVQNRLPPAQAPPAVINPGVGPRTGGSAFGIGTGHRIAAHKKVNEAIEAAIADGRSRVVFLKEGSVAAGAEQQAIAQTMERLRTMPNSESQGDVATVKDLGRIDWREGLTALKRVVVADMDSVAPALRFKSLEDYQVSHVGMGGEVNGRALETIYLDARLLKPDVYPKDVLLGVLINDLFELSAMKIAASKGVPWTTALAKAVHAEALKVAESLVPGLSDSVKRVIESMNGATRAPPKTETARGAEVAGRAPAQPPAARRRRALDDEAVEEADVAGEAGPKRRGQTKGTQAIPEPIIVQSRLRSVDEAVEHHVSHSYRGRAGADPAELVAAEIDRYIAFDGMPKAEKHLVLKYYGIGQSGETPGPVLQAVERLVRAGIRTTIITDLNQALLGKFAEGETRTTNYGSASYKDSGPAQALRYLRNVLGFRYKYGEGLFTILSGMPLFNPANGGIMPLMHDKGMFAAGPDGKAYEFAWSGTANLNATEINSGGPMPSYGGRYNRVIRSKDPAANQVDWDHVLAEIEAYDKRLGPKGIDKEFDAPRRVTYPNGEFREIAFTNGRQNLNDRILAMFERATNALVKVKEAREKKPGEAAQPEFEIKWIVMSQFVLSNSNLIEAMRKYLNVLRETYPQDFQKRLKIFGVFDQHFISPEGWGGPASLAGVLVQRPWGKSIFPFRAEFEPMMELYGYVRLLNGVERVDVEGAPTHIHLWHDKTFIIGVSELEGGRMTEWTYAWTRSMNTSARHQNIESQDMYRLRPDSRFAKELVDSVKEVVKAEPQYALELNRVVVASWLASFTEHTIYDHGILEATPKVIEQLTRKDYRGLRESLSKAAELPTRNAKAVDASQVPARIERFVRFLEWYEAETKKTPSLYAMTYRKAVNVGVGLASENAWGLKTALEILFYNPKLSREQIQALAQKAWTEGLRMEAPFPGTNRRGSELGVGDEIQGRIQGPGEIDFDGSCAGSGSARCATVGQNRRPVRAPSHAVTR